MSRAHDQGVDLETLPAEADHPAIRLACAVARRLLLFELYGLDLSDRLLSLVRRLRVELQTLELDLH